MTEGETQAHTSRSTRTAFASFCGALVRDDHFVTKRLQSLTPAARYAPQSNRLLLGYEGSFKTLYLRVSYLKYGLSTLQFITFPRSSSQIEIHIRADNLLIQFWM